VKSNKTQFNTGCTGIQLKDLPDLIPSSMLDEVFSVAHGYWAKKRVEGYGPEYVVVGRRVLYPRIKVEEWINNNIYSSTSDYEAKKVVQLSDQHDALGG
jgi:hypothetical protein